MEKIKNIKIGDTIIKSKVELTEDKLMVQFKVGECTCSGFFKKCKFCGNWTIRENGICPKCESLVKSLMKTANKESEKENATEVAKKKKITPYEKGGATGFIKAPKDETIKIKVNGLENYKVNQMSKRQITYMLQLIREGSNTNALICLKTGLKRTSVTRYLTALNSAHLIVKVSKKNATTYYFIPETVSIEDLK